MEIDRLLDEWRREARLGPTLREALEGGRLLNFHGRVVPRSSDEVFGRLAAMGTPMDDLWPLPGAPMKTEGRLAPGVRSGHGPVRYELVAMEPGRSIDWRFTNESFRGRYEYRVEAVAAGTFVENVIDGEVAGDMVRAWPEAWGPAHDWVLERIFDRLAAPPMPWFSAAHLGAMR